VSGVEGEILAEKGEIGAINKVGGSG